MVYLSLVIAQNNGGMSYTLSYLDDVTNVAKQRTGLCSDAGITYANAYTWVGTEFPELTPYTMVRSDVAFHIGNAPLFVGGRMRLNWIL